MKIDVVDNKINAEFTEHEAQILLTMVGAFNSEIPMMRQWIDELLDAGVVRPNVFVVASTEAPVLYFAEDKPQDSED